MAASPWPIPGVSTTMKSNCAQLAGSDHVADHFGNFTDRVAGCERAHVDVGMVDSIHADAIAEQGAAGFAPRRIDGNDGDAQLIAMVESKAADDFIGER